MSDLNQPDKGDSPPTETNEHNQITVGNIENAKGVAVGDNATSIVIEQIIFSTHKKLPKPEMKARFFVAFQQPKTFVGRRQALKDLHNWLQQRKTVGVVGVSAMGGVGKTLLAVQYAHRHRRTAYTAGIYWINAANDLRGEFAKLGRGLIGQAVLPTGVSEDQIIHLAAQYVTDHPDCLLIFDNIAEPTLLDQPLTTELIPAKLPCSILMTTRSPKLDNCQPLRLDMLAADEAFRLLTKRRDDLRDAAHREHATAHAICQQLGRHALAIDIMAAFIGEYDDVPLVDLSARLGEEGLLATADFEREDLELWHHKSVTAVLDEQWAALTDENARHLLKVAAQLPEAAIIPHARVGLLAGIETVGKRGRPAPLKRVLRKLRNSSLVEWLDESQMRLHPLVREYARGRVTDETAFRATCAANLLFAYWQLEPMQREYVTRGIDAIQEDLRITLELLPSQDLASGNRVSGFANPETSIGGQTRDQLQTLQRLIWRESHNLRETLRTALRFMQQLEYRIHDLAIDSLKKTVAHLLAKRPHLETAWHNKRESVLLERVLEGHSGWVNSVTVTPNGERVVSGSDDKTVRVWNLASGALERTLEGHSDSVNSVTVTPDGERVVSGSDDGTVWVWNLASGALERTLEGHSSRVSSVTMIPDGERVVSGSDDRTVRVWNLASGALERTLEGHSSRVSSVAVTPDGQRVVSGSNDRTVRVWNLASGELEHTLEGHSYWVSSVTVTPDGQRVVSGSYDIRVWNLASGVLERTLEGHSYWVSSVTVTPDGERVVSDDRTTVRVWNLASGELERTLEGHSDSVNSVTVTPDGQRVVSGSYDNTMRVWNLASEQSGRSLKGHSDVVSSIAVTPDGNWVVSGSSDGTLRILNLANGKLEQTLERHLDSVISVALTPDGHRLISGSLFEIRVTNLTSRELEQTIDTYDKFTAVMVTPDGQRAILGLAQGIVRIWNLAVEQSERSLVGHSDTIDSIAVTPDGNQVVTGSSDGTVRVWNLASGELERTIDVWMMEESGRVNSVAVTVCGRLVVTGSNDRTVRVWNLASGALEHTLEGHSAAVNSVVVTLDGRWVVSGSADKTVRVWDIETKRELARVSVDTEVAAVAVANTTPLKIVVGDAAGSLYCFELRNV